MNTKSSDTFSLQAVYFSVQQYLCIVCLIGVIFLEDPDTFSSYSAFCHELYQSESDI